jgi:hypothetical protein
MSTDKFDSGDKPEFITRVEPATEDRCTKTTNPNLSNTEHHQESLVLGGDTPRVSLDDAAWIRGRSDASPAEKRFEENKL